MAVSDAYLDFVRELLGGLGPIEIKRMFGGAALMSGGAMFALVDDDELFLKADETFAAELEAMGATRWSYSYTAGKKAPTMRFWKMPSTGLDDPELACGLCRKAMAVALAGKSQGRSRPRRKPPAPADA